MRVSRGPPINWAEMSLKLFINDIIYVYYASPGNDGMNSQWARKFKKVQAKKLVKSNITIFFREIAFLAVLNFFSV